MMIININFKTVVYTKKQRFLYVVQDNRKKVSGNS